MTATTQPTFDDDLNYEVVDGQKEVKMAGAKRGRIGANLIVELGINLKQNPIGKVYNANTTFQIGANERMPDVSVVSTARIPEEGSPAGKWEIAPDLAVEIVPPNDLWEKVRRKVGEYFAAGAQQVWLISQPEQQVMIHDSPTQIRVVTASEDLTSETLLPGFKLPVGDLFRS